MPEIKKYSTSIKERQSVCYHCGDPNPDTKIQSSDKIFCCHGCKTVYEILEANDMCDYYSIEHNPGISPLESGISKKYAYLDDGHTVNRILDYHDDKISRVSFYIPSMHCSSCVWLLESLYRLNPAVTESRVDFLKKGLALTFRNEQTTLRQIVELLASIGYEPQISLESVQKKAEKQSNKDLYLKIGVAGFCFANIMLFSFPEYLSFGEGIGEQFSRFFGYMNIFVALPVLLYSSSDYFRSAWQGWKQKMVNMDVPISLGILTLFSRSVYEIIWSAGSGFMDSFTGLVFLLLIGKLFEKKTYDTLSFERDYRSYFPVSVTRKEKSGDHTIPLERLQIGDRIIIRNEELIPADAIMINGEAFIDYSFVTGESTPVKKVSGEMIYAGGKQIGSAIELDVIKEVSQSYLTQLWNDEAFTKHHETKITTLANTVSKYFTLIVISIAFISAIILAFSSWTLALNAFTAVLIVACPCALALSTPFTLGNTLRIFGRNKFYLKNTSVIEGLAKIDSVVFDKTGTLTHGGSAKVELLADKKLTTDEAEMIASLARQSTHPLSQQIFTYFSDLRFLPVDEFKEVPGKGIEGIINGHTLRLGSAEFTGALSDIESINHASQVFAEIDGRIIGKLIVANQYRPGLSETINRLKEKFTLFLLTGDNDREKENLLQYFPDESMLYFKQSPFEKLNFIKLLQAAGKKVLMIGDGLNDAGALKKSDVGISITEDVHTFSPASDAILDGQKFQYLAEFIKFAKSSMRVIIVSFIISFLYNFIGLGFAVQGTLSPLIAAILMPLSSITVIVFTTVSTTLLAKHYGMLWSSS